MSSRPTGDAVAETGVPTPMAADFHQRITAAFEATMLIRCTRPGPSGRRPNETAPPRQPGDAVVAHRPDGVFVEFSRLDAADRLVSVLDRLGHPATRRIRIAGIRERRNIHQVVLTPTARMAVDPVLREGWRLGIALLCDTPGGYLTPRRRRHRGELAAAAWRAAVLAAGYRRRRGARGLYIGDHDTVAVLVRAARVLDLAVTAHRRSGCHLVQVPEPGSATVVAVRPAAVHHDAGQRRQLRRP